MFSNPAHSDFFLPGQW